MKSADEIDNAFSAKLALVMKVLSLSRAGLAQAVGVDKSVAGRWVSGKVLPSSYNLARLSQVIADLHPGFTMLDWEKPLADFTEYMLSGAALVGAGPDQVTLHPLLPSGLAQEATHAAGERTKAYEGLWRTIRPSSDLPGHFITDISMVRRGAQGHLHFKSGVEGFFYEGSAIMIQQQLFYFAADDAFGAVSFGVFNGVPRQRAEVLDGIIVTTLRDAGASPASSGCIMERIGDLTNDPEADEKRFEDLVKSQKMFLEADQVPEAMREHLHGASNAPGMLRMLFAQSMARGPLITPTS